jgi:NAD(P)-dependent dehydrogenase (short-subunit alcohol dehydrogenase family)
MQSSEGASLAGKVALVTGATRGIGRAIAATLARRGAHVAVVGRDGKRAHILVAEIERAGGRAVVVTADLAIPEQAVGVVARVNERLGRVDIVVNNAAYVGNLTPLLDLALDEWSTVLSTNLTAGFLISQAAARAMIAQRSGGSIVNLLAIQEHLPIAGYGAYIASKGGLAALTRALAVELGPHGIRANGLVVGSVYSESVRAVLPAQLAASDDLEVVPPLLDASAATLVGRMGRPSDVAALVAFVVSEEASFLTGALIQADGGRSLSRKPDPLIPRSVGAEA